MQNKALTFFVAFLAIMGAVGAQCEDGGGDPFLDVTFVQGTTELEARALIEGHGLVMESFAPGDGSTVLPSAVVRVPPGEEYSWAAALESESIVVSVTVVDNAPA